MNYRDQVNSGKKPAPKPASKYLAKVKRKMAERNLVGPAALRRLANGGAQ